MSATTTVGPSTIDELSSPRTLQKICVWSGVAFLVFYGLGFVVIARFIPPPAPSMSLTQLADLYANNRTGIRVGNLIAMLAATLQLPFFIYITMHIARIERGAPILAAIQAGAAVLLPILFAIPNMAWIVASFRPEADIATIRMLHDFGWLFFVMVYPGFTLQMICIGAAGLMKGTDDPVFPRWFCYLSLWAALSAGGGTLAVFFKTGPFAWNGLVGIYIGLGMFTVWILCMIPLLLRGINQGVPMRR